MFEFPPHLQEVYSQVHDWLDTQVDVTGYRRAKVDLDSDTLLGVATQYHRYFAAHYFKTLVALREVVTHDTVASWIQDNNKICVIDVGCGGGAGSTAFIEAVRQILESTHSHRKVHIHIIGIDPIKAALEVNRAVLTRIVSHLTIPKHLQITHECFCSTILDAASEINTRLKRQRTDWDQPSLPHTILLQVNVVRSLASQAQDIANAYHQIFVSTPMDRIHALTLADKATVRQTELQQMQKALEERFQDHTVISQVNHKMECEIVNPVGSWARTTSNQKKETYRMQFRSAYTTIHSAEWQRDQDWLRIIDSDNLRRAWARTRAALLRESLIDEVDIRLFDYDVISALNRLQRKLIVYAEDLAHEHDHINYTVPKNQTSFRPKSLSRLEEEILSVAIIQAVGVNYPQPDYLYAFRLNLAEKSEFLYEFWGNAFDRYVADANQAAHEIPDAMIIRTDISSYYTHIRQEYLIQRLQEKTNADSARIAWLLSKVLKKHLHPNYHSLGHGLAQGGVGSGYYANVYLSDVDSHFVQQLPDRVRFFRYVDDMVLVVAHRDQVDHLLAELDEQLHLLNLARNPEKTEFVSAMDFNLVLGMSDDLRALRYSCNKHLKAIWVVGCHYYEYLAITPETFYEFLSLYQKRVQALGLVVSLPTLRRKIMKYLNTPFQGRLLDDTIELPEFGENDGEDANIWARNFSYQNLGWIEKLNILRKQLGTIVHDLLSSVNMNYEKLTRSDNRRLRFAISRLCQLGFPEDLLEVVVDLLKREPNQLREPAFVLDSMAIQGHSKAILEVYNHYVDHRNSDTYMKALLLRAMRFHVELPVVLLMDVSLQSKASLEERLMATESLLASKLILVSDQYWAGIVNILATNMPPRLKKNFILLLRQIKDRDPQSYQPNPGDDSILYDAFNVDDGYSIFSQFEPDELHDYFEQDFPDDAYEYGEMMTTISY
ncbi:MAG: RNA-directed DNA polymerase [Anaerolineae bacterium]|nr:MAG: RNA-directed DNA polymerase [Anaerolineae bacterium]